MAQFECSGTSLTSTDWRHASITMRAQKDASCITISLEYSTNTSILHSTSARTVVHRGLSGCHPSPRTVPIFSLSRSIYVTCMDATICKIVVTWTIGRIRGPPKPPSNCHGPTLQRYWMIPRCAMITVTKEYCCLPMVSHISPHRISTREGLGQSWHAWQAYQTACGTGLSSHTYTDSSQVNTGKRTWKPGVFIVNEGHMSLYCYLRCNILALKPSILGLKPNILGFKPNT
jgi:hypothetical protein